MNYYDKEYTVLNRGGEYIKRNLYQENLNCFIDGTYDHYNTLFNEMWGVTEYDSNGCDYERYGTKIEEGEIVMDIGANIGTFSNRALHQGAKKVYCFEPVKPTFRCLIDNCDDKCELYKFGIGDKVGKDTVYIHTCLDNLGGSSLDGKSFINYGVPIVYQENIYIETINNLYYNKVFDHIDYLKIDCEGWEDKVLQGMSDTTLIELGIKKISMEYHLPQPQMEHVIKRFELLGFKFFILYKSDGMKSLHLWK